MPPVDLKPLNATIRYFLPGLIAELTELRADKARLDWLEVNRQALNAHYGTDYGWKFVRSHNVTRIFVDLTHLDLNDANTHGRDIRTAIDVAMGQAQSVVAILDAARDEDEGEA